MADEKQKTVKVRALEAHSYNGKNYDVGDTYEIDEQLVASVTTQGKAQRADTPAPPAAKPSQPVEPMTTENFGKPKPKPGKPLPTLKKPAGKRR